MTTTGASTTIGTPPARTGSVTASGAGSRPDLATRLRERGRALVLGRRGALVWERPALLGLLAVTAVLYIWDLGASGWANSFYSAAVQAGASNGEAFFFGSSDAANSITVDKPPMSLWVMALSVRIFGLSSWSILLPQALMGVATVAVLCATLRRRFSAGTALLGGAVLALTPVAALMFRFNNPDALLTLLMTLAAYFTVRAIEAGKLTWLVLAGVMIGFGFLTKQLQAFLVLPPLAVAYLWAAPRPVWTRIRHGLVAVGAMVLAFGWWVAIVELVPASMRPYIGGSQTNSFLELTFGYNGLGRLSGDETGSVTGGGGGNAGGGMWGSTGIARLFENEIGGQITWLLPAALVLSGVAYVLLFRAARTSVSRGILTVFVGWMLVTGLAFSFMAGIFHAYYTVALAPAIAAVTAIGSGMLWQRSDALWARITMAALLVGTAAWAGALLARTDGWLPWLPYAIAVVAVLAAALILANPQRAALVRTTVGLALAAGLAAPAAYTLQTVTTAHTGSIVTAGPTVQGSMGGPGGRGAGGPGGTGGPAQNGGAQNGTVPNGFGQNGGTGSTQGGPGAQGGTGQGGTGAQGQNGFGPGAQNGARAGGAGGLLGASSVSSTLKAALLEDADSYTWVAATIGSNSASGYQLATEQPVMAIGGFNGSDPSPTLAEFQALVKQGSIHYFIGSGVSGRSNGGSSASGEISAWVQENFSAQTIGGTTVYDLSE